MSGWPASCAGLLNGLAVLRDPRLGALLLIATTAAWGLEAAAYWLVGEGFGLGLAPALYLGLCGAANLAHRRAQHLRRDRAVRVLCAPGGRGLRRREGVRRRPTRWWCTRVVLIPVVLLGAVLLWRQHLGLGSLVRARERIEAAAPGDG